MTRIAFFGLGAMGEPMARRLLKAGFAVQTAIHRSRKAADALTGLGLVIRESPAAAVADAEIVITMLPADAEVRAVLLQPAFMQALQQETVIIEMSSCQAATVQEVERSYRPLGVRLIDAPVSGGVEGAEAGTLTIFGSGEHLAILAVRPVLDVLGRRIHELGKVGSGKTFKNLNNLLHIINIMGVAEVFHVVRSEGIDPQLFFDVIGSSSGNSASFQSRFLRMAGEQFEPGFKIGLARKDVANALAVNPTVPMPVSHLVHQLMLAAAAWDDCDTAAISQLFHQTAPGEGNHNPDSKKPEI